MSEERHRSPSSTSGLAPSAEGAHQQPGRLPYEPPAVISEQVFETLALSCAKVNPLACPGGNPDRS